MAQDLRTPDGWDRWQALGPRGTPTAWFDGVDPVTELASPYDAYRANLDVHLAVDVPITMTASTAFGASSVAVTITVSLEPGETLPDDPDRYVVRALLYEEEATCCSSPYEDTFHQLGRALSTGSPLTLSEPGARASALESIPIDPSWGTDLLVVAFVEHESGAIVTSSRATTTSVQSLGWGRLKSAYR